MHEAEQERAKPRRIVLVRGMALASTALCLPTIAAADKSTRAQETPDD